MLIIGVIAAFCVYVGLYWIYIAAQSHLAGASSSLWALNQIFLVPDLTIFVLLRGLIIATVFYVIADALLSPTRRGLRHLAKRREAEERNKKVFRGSKAVPPPAETDDTTFGSYHSNRHV